MKAILKTLTAVLLLAVSCNAWSMNINKFHSGSWWNSSQNGHGFSIEVLNEDLVVLYWYVYNPDGTSTFLLTVGEIDGDRASGNTFYYSGMRWGEFDPATLNEEVWGTVTITFHGCNSATLQYSSTMSHEGVPFGSGTIQLERLLSIEGMYCLETPLAGNFHITAVSPEGLGFGIGVSFENGDLAYFAVSEGGAEVGLGGIALTGPETFTFSGTAYDVLGGVEGFSGNGEVFEDGLSADLGFGTLLAGSRLYSFQHQLPQHRLAGTYTVIDLVFQEQVANLTVAANGQVTGTTLEGCDLTGWLFVPNQNVNQVFVDVTQSNCATPDRILGAGMYDFDVNEILAFGSDGTYGYIWELIR